MAAEIITSGIGVCQNLLGLIIDTTVRQSSNDNPVVIHEVERLMPRDLAGYPFLRLGGLSAALALVLAQPEGVYGIKPEADYKSQWEFINKVHIVTAFGLLAVPLANRPYLTGNLLLFGSVWFCGSLYSHGIKKSPKCIKYAPYGGLMLLLGFASFLL